MCLSLLFKTKHNFYSEDIQFSYSSAKLTCLDSWKKKNTHQLGGNIRNHVDFTPFLKDGSALITL